MPTALTVLALVVALGLWIRFALRGHPPGLSTLFFTEMWERFTYYGMRALLVLFMIAAVENGGMGFSAEKAGPIYAMYVATAYLATVPGGWLADNFLGQRRSVLWGGIMITIGNAMLIAHSEPMFYGGLACIAAGVGMLKPNVSVIVGQLYSREDTRRDAGFSVFYMGINLGAGIAPLACGWLAQSDGFKDMLEGWGMDPKTSWHWGFGAAALGMALGVVQFVLMGRRLGDAGIHPTKPATPAVAARHRRTLTLGLAGVVALAVALVVVNWMWPGKLNEDSIHTGYTVLLVVIVLGFFGKLFLTGEWTPSERARLVTIFVLFCGASVFWGIFEQAGSTLTIFAERSTENVIPFLDKSFPSSFWQSVNAVLIIVLAPLFAMLWLRLGKHDPSYPTKFAVGLLFAGLGFLVLVGGAKLASDGTRVSPAWLLAVYSLHTIGELCLSPVGLSSMTKLAPARVVSLMMGVWFLAASVGNFIGGSVAGYYESFQNDLPKLFMYVALSGFVMAAVMFALVIPIKRMMARNAEPKDKAATPVETASAS